MRSIITDSQNEPKTQGIGIRPIYDCQRASAGSKLALYSLLVIGTSLCLGASFVVSSFSGAIATRRKHTDANRIMLIMSTGSLLTNLSFPLDQ